MYTKQQAARLKQEFWTAFGQYMAPILSSEGERINWINYKTGEKNLHFKMQADNKMGIVSIEIGHPDLDIQQLYFEQFGQLKQIFYNTVNEEWNWLMHTSNEYGKTVSLIYTELNNVSIFKKEDWPALISFFKKHIMALDAFWNRVKYSFEMLR